MATPHPDLYNHRGPHQDLRIETDRIWRMDRDDDDDDEDEDDHDDGDRDIETYQRWQPVAGKVVTQRILSIVALHISQSLEFTSAHIGIVLYCIAIVKKSTNLVIWDTKSGLKLRLKKDWQMIGRLKVKTPHHRRTTVGT